MNHPADEAVAVLFSAGLDSAVLLAHAVTRWPGARIQPLYVSAGLAWEREEIAMAERFLAAAGLRFDAQPAGHSDRRYAGRLPANSLGDSG